MEVLFVVPYVPSLVRVRPYHLIARLARRGNRVTVLTVFTTPEEQEEANALKALGAEIVSFPISKTRSWLNSLAVLPSRRPLQTVYSWQAHMASSLVNEAQRRLAARQNFVVHVEHLRGVQYALHLQKSLPQAHVPVIWDSVDSISLLFRQASGTSKSLFGRLITRLELGRTRYYESWLPKRFNRVLVTSPKDRDEFYRLGGGEHRAGRIEIVPNGVDLDYFTCAGQESRNPSELVLTGKMSYHANVTMALYLVGEIMPHVWAKAPDARVTIAGKEPPREVLALSQDPRVQVTGSVSDIRPYIQKAAVAVAPLVYGVGIQNKILEAMACGTPVVTTGPAVSALQARPGEDLLVADDPAGFAGQVLALLADPALRQQIGFAGRQYVEKYHHWEEIVAKLEQIYREEMDADKL